MTALAGAGRLLRLCLDLNVWCAALIAERRGRTSGSSTALVEAARRAECPLGAVQLVVSWGMLDRLRETYVDKLGLSAVDANANIDAIAEMARLGPTGDAPYLLLGGTGLMPISDSEDAHVLDVAVAGVADVLATANLDDFVQRGSEMLRGRRVILHRAPNGHQLVIAHPDQAAGWLRRRSLPTPAALRRLIRARR